MKISLVSRAVWAAWSLGVGVVGAQQSPRSSEEVYAEAVSTAHAPDQNGAMGTHGDARTGSAMDPEVARQQALKASQPGGPPAESRALVFTSVADPNAVAADAVAAANAPDQNVAKESKVNSQVIPTMPAAPVTAAK